MAERKRLEEEAHKKQEEEEDRQRDLAKHLEVDRIAAVV